MPEQFDSQPILSYLGLPSDYNPSPSEEPIPFLRHHLHSLPPDFLVLFSSLTTPKQRATIPAIRNRRLKYAESGPVELGFVAARSSWPTLWEGRELRGKEEGKEEQDWAEKEFLTGSRKHIGKLGALLAGYEEERETERVRTLRRLEAERIPEEEEDSDDEPESADGVVEDESPEEAKIWFLRLVKERLIYGLLSPIDYNKVDWDERWDSSSDRYAEERWFDEEEEEEAAPIPE